MDAVARVAPLDDPSGGRSTESMMCTTPLVASMSAVTTFASLILMASARACAGKLLKIERRLV